MQSQLTSGVKHSDLDMSYSKSKDVELATSYRTTGINRVTFAENESDYKPPQNMLNELNNSRASVDSSNGSQPTTATNRFQIAKANTLKDRISVKKLKHMKFSQFVDSLEIEVDMKLDYAKFAEQNIYFFSITSKRMEDKGTEHSWLIRRRYQDLVAFDYKVRKELKQKKLKKQMPDLPFKKEPQNQNPKDILNFLEAYLIAMISLEHVCKTIAFWEFIELSDYNHDGIVKVKESFIKKRAGGHFKRRNCFDSCVNPFNAWKKRYVVITSEAIMYSIGNRSPDTAIREMLLFDHNFSLKYGKLWSQREFGIVLTTTTRRLQLEGDNLFHFVDIIAAVKDAMRLSPYVELHRYDSFAPIRQKSFCQWYVDGEGYFSSLYEKLINANHEVFITDWWLSPEMYLQRPVNEYTNQQTRLDRVLEKIANRGVKVYIIVYREPTIALNLNSNYTKNTLQALSKNIRVMRHPSTLIPLLWSHHEKMVIIDQMYGYLGGLDLCYGRWDSQSHPLIDQNQAKLYFPGIDYSNARIKDFRDVKEFNKSEISRETQPRMPWHDIAMMVVGEPVRDMTRHFIQYWNFAKMDIYSKNSKEQIDHLVPGMEEKEKSNMSQIVSQYWNKILSKLKLKKKNDEEHQETSKSIDFEGTNQSINSIVDQVSNISRSKTIQVNRRTKGNRFLTYLDKIKEEIEENQQHQTLPDEEKQKQQLSPQKIYSIKREETPNQLNTTGKSDSNFSKVTFEEKTVPEDLKNILGDLTSIKSQNQTQEREYDVKNIRPKNNSNIEMSIVNSSGLSKQDKAQDTSINSNVNESMILPKLLNNSVVNNSRLNNSNSINSQKQVTKPPKKESQDYNNTSTILCNNPQTKDNKEQNIKVQNSIIIDSNKLNNSTHQTPFSNSPKINTPQNSSKEQQNHTSVLLSHFHNMKDNNNNDPNQNEQKISDQLMNNRRIRKSDFRDMRATRSTSMIIPAAHPNNRETYKPFSLEYEDMHELNKYNLYVPIIERLKRNYEDESEQDQNYYIIFNKQQSQEQNQKNMGRSQTQGSTFFNLFRTKAKVAPTQNTPESNDSPRRNYSEQSQYSHTGSYIMNHSKEDDDSFDNSFGLFPKKRNFDRLKLENTSFMQNGSCICQMLRSSSSWSLGLEQKNHEMSIQLAYIDLITSSSNYIYIENQFFISCSAGNKVKNLIAQALIERIKKAADNDENFKVVVVMPLLPGFEGEVNDSGSGVMKCQLHWEYSTISRGGSSILEELRAHPKIYDPSKYIQFYGLRQHAVVDKKPVTEIIYVHSKLMIVDDNYVIMGSANINDRSMLGTRDSEIAMIVEDTEKIYSNWNGGVKKVGKFSHTLRTALYQEHFGLNVEEADDPLCESTNNLIVSRSKQNTLIYRQVFACYPDDKVETLSQLDDFQKSKNTDLYNQYKDIIIGNAVDLPLDFLKRENLNFSISQKEYFVPDENFT